MAIQVKGRGLPIKKSYLTNLVNGFDDTFKKRALSLNTSNIAFIDFYAVHFRIKACEGYSIIYCRLGKK